MEQGIIIEDDILPSEQLFNFVNNLLDKYKHDNRIAMISGYQTVPVRKEIENSYYFSPIGFTWGWGTWRRFWQTIDFQMSNYEKIVKNISFASRYLSSSQGKSWKKKFTIMYNKGAKFGFDGAGQHWDRKLNYTMAINSQFSISPKYNLLQNVGYGDKATHTKTWDRYVHQVEVIKNTEELTHPENISVDCNAVRADLARRFPTSKYQKTLVRLRSIRPSK